MVTWEYCEVDFDGSTTREYIYDEAGVYIDNPLSHSRLGIMLSILGHDGWEIISQWWRSRDQVTYTLQRPVNTEWTDFDREKALQIYNQEHPRDKKY
jgi:hypothetical protein